MGTLLFVFLLCLTATAKEEIEYAKVEALVRAGQWDQALSLLQPLLRAEPQDLKARNLMGIALTGKGNLPEANEQFQLALKTNPRFAPALKNLAVNEVTLRQMEAAEKHFKAAKELVPYDPVVNMYLGEFAYSRREHAQAVKYFKAAWPYLLRYPEFAIHSVESHLEGDRKDVALNLLKQLNEQDLDHRFQFHIGLMLARRDLFAEAIPFFESVRARFPNSYEVGYNLAICHVATKQSVAAIEILTGLRDQGHKTAELLDLLADAYEGNKQTQQAVDVLREATILAPREETLYLDLAGLCMDHGNYELGIEIVNVGLHYVPDSYRLVFIRAVLYALSNQFGHAEEDFELASRLAPEMDLVYVGLGMTFMQRSNLPEAARVLRERIKESPNHYVLQYLLGEALIRSGIQLGDPNFEEAKAALERSVHLNPEFHRSRIDLAKLYLKQNRVEEAIEHLEKARALRPDEQPAYAHLATAYRRKGQPEKAAAMLEKVKQLNDYERTHNYRDLVRIVKVGSPLDAAFKDLQRQAEAKSATPKPDSPTDP